MRMGEWDGVKRGGRIDMLRIKWGKRAGEVLLLWAGAAIGLPAQTFTKLHTFSGTDGGSPAAALVQATNGDLYGTSSAAGTSSHNAGTVYKIGTGGRLTSLYNFCSQTNCADGQNPFSVLVQARNGNFYGTTLYGGTGGPCVGNQGCGVAFKITPNGTFTILHTFCSLSNCADGEFPAGGLALGNDGALYGVTQTGGPTVGCSNGCGTVYKITPGGNLTTLYDFCSASECVDGVGPDAALLLGRDGNFYGTTTAGGNAGRGVAFKITPSGNLTVLYSFCSQSNCSDGLSPEATLAQGTDGNFYGSTTGGGTNSRGTLFQLTPSSVLTTLYNFCSLSNCTDGYMPSPLIQATDGNLYGVTHYGGTSGYGTIFQITSSSAYTMLYGFCARSGCPDGVYPSAALTQNTNGTLYGATTAGGNSGHGTVFSFAVGLGPFVETKPTSGAVGAVVTILGTSLTGATSVKFNGTTATFTVVSDSEITTTVPTGATTGKVKVATTNGTLSSNVAFRVTA
jgi:uncharacterized repeat protein (TIGR03803 family)